MTDVIQFVSWRLLIDEIRVQLNLFVAELELKIWAEDGVGREVEIIREIEKR